MKRVVLVVLCFFLFVPLAIAINPKEFVWLPPTTNVDGTPLTDLAGYKVYCGTSSRNYTITKDVGMLQPDANTGEVVYLVSNVIPAGSSGTYYCAVTAYDAVGNESDYSNEVEMQVDFLSPAAPGNFKVR